MQSPEFLTTDSAKRTVEKRLIYDEELQTALPDLQQYFLDANIAYTSDRSAYLDQATLHLKAIEPQRNGANFKTTAIFDSETAKSKKVMLVYGAFADVAPETTTSELNEHYLDLSSPSQKDCQKARPHSWNQTTKSSILHELLKASGQGMPVLTIYSPIPRKVYDKQDRKQIYEGDYDPVTLLAIRSLVNLQVVLHGFKSETQISTVHFKGESIGASYAVASAAMMARLSDRYKVGSVTAQELILGPKSFIPDLLKRYVKGTTGDPSTHKVSSDVPVILEPTARMEIDGEKSERQSGTRTLTAMFQIAALHGLTKPRKITEEITELNDAGVSTTLAIGVNSAPCEKTLDTIGKDVLSGDNVHVIKVRGVEGEKTGHIINEHVALTGTIALLGVTNASKD